MTLLQLSHLSLQQGQRLLCRNLNLTIQKGERWAILGPNGCGKTTLLHALMGLHPISAGQILLNTRSLHTLSAREVAKSLGLLFQEPRMPFPQSVWQYCLAGRYPHQTGLLKKTIEEAEAIHAALQQVKWTHAVDHCVTALSGGERRRVSIAKLLVQAPMLYLLDEPTNHLDLQHQVTLLTHFKKMATSQQSAFIMTTHDINLAQQYCDHVLLFYPDQSVQIGPIQTLLTAENLTRLYQQAILRIEQNNMLYWIPEPAR